MSIVDPLFQDGCDPACQLEQCLHGLMPPDWQKVKGCKGPVSVNFFVRRLLGNPAKATLRQCQKPQLAVVQATIEADLCGLPDCAAGFVEQYIRDLLCGCLECCCSTLVSDIETDRTFTSEKPKKEIRVLTFSLSLNYEKPNSRSEQRKMRRLAQQEKVITNV